METAVVPMPTGIRRSMGCHMPSEARGSPVTLTPPPAQDLGQAHGLYGQQMPQVGASSGLVPASTQTHSPRTGLERRGCGGGGRDPGRRGQAGRGWQDVNGGEAQWLGELTLGVGVGGGGGVGAHKGAGQDGTAPLSASPHSCPPLRWKTQNSLGDSFLTKRV